MPFPASELILHPNGSIYHLHLLPEQVADTVFFVGDPDRVPKVSKHFDRIDHKVQKREFVTHTGELGGKRVSVISTGIGPDNIDIVMNELDALVNIDLKTHTVKDSLTSLNIVRIGTSGSLSADIPVDSFLVSAHGIGLDNLLHYYDYPANPREEMLRQAFTSFAASIDTNLNPIATEADQGLVKRFGQNMHRGITLTCPGFYAPQGRKLRLGSIFQQRFFDKIGEFSFENLRVTNFEMETSAILGLSRMLGHRATACNAILANRITGEFSKDPKKLEERLIEQVLASL
ncbi:MAG: nucleoside phosphorylase [Saprospiraceae bacterium]|nr:nucleoside phosphorylase [Saprospiraceae bacterium]MCF8250797.1 nucleoside phosphorylase [Saprospiraceae bacterium]MCF8283011.1 nucleoside phosphorylase [Bacteroidales bacterium]MCF8312598.1 nucleoside phosphorylase [Saprospiraceae bacterium]MCF8440927.1 nucleoside phosphorylase [Saprospiraceae bacterium]